MVATSGLIDYLCGNLQKITQLHVLAWVMFVLNTVSLIVTTQDSQTGVIIGLNYLGITLTIIVTGSIMLSCRHR
jgi:hypothetical protein